MYKLCPATLLQQQVNRIKYLFEKYNGRGGKRRDFSNQRGLKSVHLLKGFWTEALAPTFGVAHRLSPYLIYEGS